MDQSTPLVKDFVCQKHEYYPLDLIDLTGTSENGRICRLCIEQKQIPQESYLQISEIFEQNQQREILSTYPPFKNQKMREQIFIFCDENTEKEKIDSFFRKLREDIELAIQLAENKAKQSLIKNQDTQRNFIKEIAKISEIDKLKQLLITGSEKLNEFLQEKWQNADLNEKRIETLIDEIQFNNQFINFEKKEKETNSIIQLIQQFSLFMQPIKFHNKNVNFQKSTYGKSQDSITLKNHENSLKFINTSKDRGQAFLDFVLDPKKRYTIKLNYQPKAQDESYFLFGIVNDQSKDSNWCHFVSEMSYFNVNGGWGIGKYIKGPNITQNSRKNKKEEFEVRIFLDEKKLKVASLPGYESILELDDLNKIKQGIQYRFFVIVKDEGDMIEITEVIESDCFQNDEF